MRDSSLEGTAPTLARELGDPDGRLTPGLLDRRSATQSSCSFVRSSCGSATSPSTIGSAPSFFSRLQTAMRGVEGSRGSR